MGKVTVFCIVSPIIRSISPFGSVLVVNAIQRCRVAPEVAHNLRDLLDSYGPTVTSALESLADDHELRSQDDLCVIAPVDPSGQLLLPDNDGQLGAPYIDDTDVRVVPHCVMGDAWDFGFVDAPPSNASERNYYMVSFGLALMVHTYALDVMALATRGRMTPLRLWRLAMQQGYEDADHLDGLEGVHYGEIAAEREQFPNPFPGYYTLDPFEHPGLLEMEDVGGVEVVKQRMIHEGGFWMWMAPDRFPVSPTEHDSPMWLPEAHPSASLSPIENLPPEMMTPIVSSLPISSVFDLVNVSRSMRAKILGNDYLACVWIYNNAPWWIPVPTQTPKKDDSPPTVALTDLASQWGPHVQLTMSFPTRLDWAYVIRCLRSGSMRNRKRIWNTVLDIENAADLAGV